MSKRDGQRLWPAYADVTTLWHDQRQQAPRGQVSDSDETEVRRGHAVSYLRGVLEKMKVIVTTVTQCWMGLRKRGEQKGQSGHAYAQRKLHSMPVLMPLGSRFLILAQGKARVQGQFAYGAAGVQVSSPQSKKKAHANGKCRPLTHAKRHLS